MAAFKTVRSLLVALVVLLTVALACAQSLETLQNRFKQRYSDLNTLRTSGQVGETFAGLVEAATAEAAGDEQVAAIVRAENKDRAALYRIMAAKADTTSKKVAERNLARYLRRARKTELVKAEDGRWRTVVGYERHRKLLRLKQEGKIGETWQGLVEPVRSEFGREPIVRKLLAEENKARKLEYAKTAKKQNADEDTPRTTSEQVGQREAKKYFRYARPGHFLKQRDDSWRHVPPRD